MFIIATIIALVVLWTALYLVGWTFGGAIHALLIGALALLVLWAAKRYGGDTRYQ